MKKWALLAVMLLAVVLLSHLLSRAEAPQRDYFAEYDAMRTAQWARHQRTDSDGVAAWQALTNLNRYETIERVADAAIAEAFEHFGVERGSMQNFDEQLLAMNIRGSRKPLFENPWYEDPDYEPAMRVVEFGRPIVDRAVRELHQRPEVRRAIANAIEHDIVLHDRVPSPTLIESLQPYIHHARSTMWADASMIRSGTDPEKRLESLRSGLLAVRIAATDPTAINWLVLMSGDTLFSNEMIDAFASPSRSEGLSPDEWLRELQKHRSMRPVGAWFIEGERLMALDMLDAEYTKRAGAIHLNSLARKPVIGVSHARAYEFFDGIFDKLVEYAGKNHAEQALSNWDDQLEQILQAADFRLRPLADALMPTVSPHFTRAFRSEASLNAAEAVLAIAAYRADNDGVWPESLNDLVPRYLEAVPLDPFAAAGAPMRYRIAPDGSPLLYSLGPNGQDDGGVPAEYEQALRERGDLVFLPRP